MPLSELYQMAKGKVSSSEEKNPSCYTDLSFEPEDDFFELVWENGQILMQGQSSRVKKFPTSSGFQSHCFSSHSPKTRDKDWGNGTSTRMGNFGATNSALNETPISVPSAVMGLTQDDDMVPWLNYPIDQSLEHEYYSDFLPDLSGVTVNESSTRNNFASFDRRSDRNPSVKDSRSVSVHNIVNFEQGNVSKVSEPADGEAARGSQLYSIPSPHVKPRGVDRISDGINNVSNHHVVCGGSIGVRTSAGGFEGTKMQKQDPSPPSNGSGLMNFSHFLRPALGKARVQNIGATANVERMRSNEKGSAASSTNLYESTLIDSNSGLWNEKVLLSKPTIMTPKVDAKGSEAKPQEKPSVAELPPAMCQDDILMSDKGPCPVTGEGATRGLPDGEKTIEPAVTSSVCSVNGGERISDDPPHNLKRKQGDNEESECGSEDAEEESIGVKKSAPTRPGTGSKRSRAAEVHNLSERRRRDRINEKMRALQELIPNCNKVDKASMLDEAIEYLKTLQIQVQIMSMGAGLYMPPMMLPTGMQHMHAAHMARYSPMGVGMGMAMGYGLGLPDMNGGSSACPMVHLPPMHGAPFPGQQMSGLSALQGVAGSNLQSFVLPGQGLPMSVPCAPTPLIPMSGGPLLKSTMGLSSSGIEGPLHNMDSSITLTSKDPLQNINSQAIQITGAGSSMNQTLSQCLTTNESFEQPVTVQDNRQASDVTESMPVRSTDGNDKST
ncbi:hypothetical protein SLE2022_064990 [Rubroshorea leprosula]